MFIKKNNYPFLTIAIPTFKRPERLRKLLSLLSKQKDVSQENFEIIVSDNCSEDSTKSIVDSFMINLPMLRYFCQKENIGSERNIYSLFSIARGSYVWLMPDDDQIEGEYTITKLINKINACKYPPSLIMLNAKSIDINSNAVINERFNPIYGDIFLSDGRDILNILTDFDLIGAQRIVVRRDIFPNKFIDNYMENPDSLIPMVCALVAAANGPALIVGEVLTVFGDNDPTPWRVYWPYIALQLMPKLLLKAAKELGYSQKLVNRIIQRRKYENYNSIIIYRNSHFLIFQKYKLSLVSLIELYGLPFIAFKILIGLPVVAIRILLPVKLIKYVLAKFK